jgi:hypothetical protein
LIRRCPRRSASRLAAAALPLLLATSGCYSYTYHLRGPPPDLQRIAVEASPHTAVRWSSIWGAQEDEWSPVRCASTDAAGKCLAQTTYCDSGLGQVEVSYTAATFLLTVFTLGLAVPMRVSAWCATDVGPHHGP